MRLAALRTAGRVHQPKERTTAPERISAVRQAAQQRRERLLSSERVPSRGGAAKARPPFAARAAEGEPASMDRYSRSAYCLVPWRSAIRRRSSSRGYGLGVTRRQSRSLSGANRARNPEQPRSVKKRSAAASVGVRHADSEQGDRPICQIKEPSL